MKPSDVVYGCILVSPRGRIGLVRGRSTGKWSFPKGHPNRGETPFQCAFRETQEETGIRIPWQTRRPVKLSVGYYYIILTDSEYPMQTSDISEIMETGWLTLDEMLQSRVNIDVSTFLKKIIKPEVDVPVWNMLNRRCNGFGYSMPSQVCIPLSDGDSPM